MSASEPIVATTEAERQAIYRFRYEVFIEELKLDLPADHERRLMLDAPDEHPMLIYVEDDCGIAGVVSLHFGADAPFSKSIVDTYGLEPFRAVIGDHQMAIGTRLATRPDMRGSSAWHTLQWGIATNQLGRGLEVTFVGCELHLVNFYLRIGYRPYKPPIAGYNGSVMFVPMVFVGGDFAFLRRIDSPILALFGETTGTPAIAERLLPLIANPPLVSAGASAPDDYLAMVETNLVSVPARQDLFEGLHSEEIRSLLAGSHILDLPQGAQLIVQGKLARTVFVVLEGQLDVIDRGRTLARVTTGHVLGELAFLIDVPRTANVTVVSSQARLLCLAEKPLKGLAAANPRAAATLWLNMSKALARRLVSTTKL